MRSVPLQRLHLTNAVTLAGVAVARGAGALYMCCAGCTRKERTTRAGRSLETYANSCSRPTRTRSRRARPRCRDRCAARQPESRQTLDAARERWREARIPYSYSEAFRFYAGPIDGEGGPEGQLNGWPLDENHIDAVRDERTTPLLASTSSATRRRFPTITPELIAAQNEAGGEKNIASGYHAIEFLLWGQDPNDPPESAGQRPYTDFVAQSAIARRRRRTTRRISEGGDDVADRATSNGLRDAVAATEQRGCTRTIAAASSAATSTPA